MDLSLISCSYNTPEITISMLKSWIFKHQFNQTPLVLMDNSTNEDTANLLNHYQIPFYRRPGTTHSVGVDEALKICKTKYALLVDSDVLFNKNLSPIIDKFISSGYTLLGERCADRGAFKLYPRIHPWFCFINVENLNKFGISFHDQVRIDNTKSNQFFTNVPDALDNTNFKYDVGATLYEDVINNGLKVGNAKFDDVWFTHYEGMSWYHKSSNPLLHNVRQNRFNHYMSQIKSFEHIDPKGRFV